MTNSTEDTRTQNNVMRHAYRALSENEKIDMQVLKDLGLQFYRSLETIATHTEDRKTTRELELAKTKVEEAVMWGVKHVTG